MEVPSEARSAGGLGFGEGRCIDESVYIVKFILLE